MDLQEIVQHKRFILDLIEDVEIAVCKYNIRGDNIVDALNATVSKHVANLQNELVELSLQVPADTNFLCNMSCS